jgi:HIV Tat-specific factor 1
LVWLLIFLIPFLIYFTRFGGRQIHASEDDGLINHATVRDLEEDAKRLEKFGEELEGE